MLRKVGIILFLFLNVHLFSFGQADITVKQLSLAEHALLDFITTDSVNDLSLHIFKENLKFGVPNKLANGVSLLKKKDKIYLQLMVYRIHLRAQVLRTVSASVVLHRK